MREVVAFIVSPGFSIAVGFLVGDLLKVHLSQREESMLVIITYTSALVFGFPSFLLLGALRRQASYDFILTGVTIGLITYWIGWELLPVMAAYREGRYSVFQAVAALTSLEQPLNGVYAGGIGALSSLMIWLLSRRSPAVSR